MQTSPHGLALIRRFEGFSAQRYRCPAGMWTIGYGHVMVAGDPKLVTREAAATMLVQDVRVAERAVMRLIAPPLRQHQFDALVSFTFNLGSGALQRSTMRRVVNAWRHEEVPEQLMRWVYAAGAKQPGLIRRRRAEGLLYTGLAP